MLKCGLGPSHIAEDRSTRRHAAEVLEAFCQNTETVIKTAKGWIPTTLIASSDAQRVVIHSHWRSAADVEAMRADPRMIAYFPIISELAASDSIVDRTFLRYR